MLIDSNMVISGFVSKVVNDCVDVLKEKIKNADKNRKANEQNIETRIYQVTIDALNEFPYNQYKKEEKVYDAAESILKGFKGGKEYKEAIRVGLEIVIPQVTDDICNNFLCALHYEICKDKSDFLYKEITLIQQAQIIEKMDEGFKDNNQNHEKTHSKLDYAIEGIDFIKENINSRESGKIESSGENPIKNRAEEYAGRWNKNVFLNDFNKRDKNAGVNIKLRDLYLDKLLPHYIWGTNDTEDTDIEELLKEYIIDINDKKMLLILGQPGIGKSTLITWIMTNLVEKKDKIYVYQFAADLDRVDWKGKNVLNNIFNTIGLEYDELENKTIILDGFDKVFAGNDRENILNRLNQELEMYNTLKVFSLIITCRENYI